MRRRNFLAMGAGAAGVVAMPRLATANAATAAAHAAASRGQGADSLRALAAKIGLRVGTAVIPFDLNTPAYTAILASQFSAVTPGNELKWEVVEPQRGVFDWSGADRLTTFAEQHGQLVRGHTLLWHNQLPGWLTTGVANGYQQLRTAESAGAAHLY
jgi:endo-1,4-beta-xylanase